MQKLFAAHLQRLVDLVGKNLGNFDAAIFSSGEYHYYFEDDQPAKFRAAHHFAWFCPLTDPLQFVVVEKGTASLLRYQPNDYWHEVESLQPSSHWVNSFQVEVFDDLAKLKSRLAKVQNTCHIGPPSTLLENVPSNQDLVHLLNWHRAYKSEYEVVCLSQATEIAANGHRAAKKAFFDGRTEFDIFAAYTAAISTDVLPYHAIVAGDDKAAILHYQNRRTDYRPTRTLLIDAGALAFGYGSDITRTYALESSGPFGNLVAAMDKLQQRLCQETWRDFPAMHEKTRLWLAELLLSSGIATGVSAESLMTDGTIDVFFPHGLGHLLGIFVHDVGGKYTNSRGELFAGKVPRYLRCTRPIEPGMVFTVEPGLYFIDSLLEPLRAEKRGKVLDWGLIDQLRPYGGIRIEDNVLAGANGSLRNLTRPHLE